MYHAPIAVQGVLTPADLLRDVHRRLRVAYALFGLWAALEILNGFLHGASSFIIAGGVILLTGALEFSLRRASQRHPQVGQVWMELSDEGVAAVTPVMSARQEWTTYKDYRETPTAFLLGTGGTQQILPKHFFTDPAQLAAARTLLAQHLAVR